jgi:rhodanese-related sulfurtransferase
MTIHSPSTSYEAKAGSVAIPTISASLLHAAVRDADEIAVVDVREGNRFETGHISVAVPLPLSEIELRVAHLLPRKGIRLVVSDDDGGAIGTRAARRLLELGYTDVRLLEGGVAAWHTAGFELITGLNSLSKALGEFIERHYHTPKVSVEELHRRIAAGDDLVILDTRPLDEFHHISIPGGVAAPGAELLYRAFDAVPSPDTPVVINCAGRTRAIIGAQALRNAGFPNPVVSLENGTSAWILAGFEPGRGATGEAGAPSAAGLARAGEAAARIASRFGVQRIDAAQLEAFRTERDTRSLYLLDIRTPEEFAAGHLPGARSAPGGQVVQATDSFIATRDGRVVLIDGEDAVRATISASWLIQLGLEHVFVYAAPHATFSEAGVSPIPIFGDASAASLVAPTEALRLLASEEAVILDLDPAPPYFRERRYIPDSFIARRSTLPHSIDLTPGSGPIILTSLDGHLARFAAAEVASATGRRVVALAGGTQAWIDAGFEHRTGLDQAALQPDEALAPVPSLEERRVNLDAYVKWGDVITEQLERDGLVRFRAFD